MTTSMQRRPPAEPKSFLYSKLNALLAACIAPVKVPLSEGPSPLDSSTNGLVHAALDSARKMDPYHRPTYMSKLFVRNVDVIVVLLFGDPSKLPSSVPLNYDCFKYITEIRDLAGDPSFPLSYLRSFMDMLSLMSQCDIVSIRFFVCVVTISILTQVWDSSNRVAISVSALAILSDRRHDRCDQIRLLVGMFGLVELGQRYPDSVVSDDLLISTFEGLLSDPSKHVRLRALRSAVSMHQCSSMSGVRKSLVLSKLSQSIAMRCFDIDKLVAVEAIRILTDVTFGEEILEHHPDLHESICNLVWIDGARSKKPRAVTRDRSAIDYSRELEALKFINNHILNTPGILCESGSNPHKLAMLVEFIDQYSDGYVFAVTSRLIAVVFAHFHHQGSANFLEGPGTFSTWLTNLYTARRDASENDRISLDERFNTTLEVLHASLLVNKDETRDEFQNSDVLTLVNAFMETTIAMGEVQPNTVGRRSNWFITDCIRTILNGKDCIIQT